MAIEPRPCRWRFPPATSADHIGVVGLGADLAPGTLLYAYRNGLFPMPAGHGGPLAWWSPDPRGVIPLDGLRISRSLRRSIREFEIRVDTAFDRVVAECAHPDRPHGWITREIRESYGTLHELGWAHSVEAWSAGGGALAGGLYGVSVGGLFAGESMFHHRRDASKVALVALVGLLRAGGATLLDVQWQTDHLASLGCVEIRRDDYLDRLQAAVALKVDPFA